MIPKFDQKAASFSLPTNPVYCRKEKREMDRVSLHSGMLDTAGSLRKDGSVFSGSGYYPGPQQSLGGQSSHFQRGGLRGSNASMKSTRSR